MNKDLKANTGNTAVILPVYNSSRHLRELVKDIGQYISTSQIIAVDDGSVDDSAFVCESLNLKLISFTQNQGKGAALWAGLQLALASGYQFAFCLDSDQQHAPHHIPQFLEVQNDFDSDLILGRRSFSTRDMPWQRICSNKLTSFMVSISIRKKIYDSQCGYRFYRLNILDGFVPSSQRYQFETEILLKLAGKKIITNQVPIDTIYGSEKSHISHFRDIFNFIKIILKFWVQG